MSRGGSWWQRPAHAYRGDGEAVLTFHIYAYTFKRDFRMGPGQKR